MPGPWAGGELGQLDLTPLAPLPEPSSPLQPPELPTIQVCHSTAIISRGRMGLQDYADCCRTGWAQHCIQTQVRPSLQLDACLHSVNPLTTSAAAWSLHVA